MEFYVYIIESDLDGTLYKGVTTDWQKRLEQHNQKRSQYTSAKVPWKIVYLELLPTKSAALIREKQLKRQHQNYLRWLIEQPTNLIRI